MERQAQRITASPLVPSRFLERRSAIMLLAVLFAWFSVAGLTPRPVQAFESLVSRKGSMQIEEAAVVLHLRIRVKAENEAAFFKYVEDAFPLFMKNGDSTGVVYRSADDPESYDEVFYYRTEEAYQAGEKAVAEDPVVMALLKRWRALLAEPPQVEVHRPVQR